MGRFRVRSRGRSCAPSARVRRSSIVAKRSTRLRSRRGGGQDGRTRRRQRDESAHDAGRRGIPLRLQAGGVGRLEDGFPSTESHFSQIRPTRNASPVGRNIDKKNGTGQGANAPVVKNGT